MSVVLPKLARLWLLAGLMLSASAPVGAQQPARREPPKIEFTEPARAVSTNAAGSINIELTPRKPGYGREDQAVHKPFEIFDAEDSFSGVAAPPARTGRPSSLNSQRARERLDREKNWVFSTPEEIYGLSPTEQELNAPEYDADGLEKKPKSRIERYFERLEKKQAEAATNRLKKDSLPDWLKSDDSEDPLSFKHDDKESDHSIFGTGKANSKGTSANSQFTSPFGGGPSYSENTSTEFFSLGGGGSNSKTIAPDPGAAMRLQMFSETLKARSPVSPGLGLGFDVTAPSSPVGSPLQSPFSAGMFGRDSLSPQPAPGPSSLPSIAPGTTLPGAYAPALSPPPAASVIRAFGSPPSAFELPQRKF